jgi:hypothetical protein
MLALRNSKATHASAQNAFAWMEIAKAENSAKPIIGTQAFVVGVAGSP